MSIPELDALNAKPLAPDFFEQPALALLPTAPDPMAYPRLLWNLLVWQQPLAELKAFAVANRPDARHGYRLEGRQPGRDIRDGILAFTLDPDHVGDVAWRDLIGTLEHPRLNEANQEVLLRYSTSIVELSIVMRNELSANLVDRLVRDEDVRVRQLVAQHARALDTAAFERLSEDPDPEVRKQLLTRYDLPDHVLEKLCEDVDPTLASEATNKYTMELVRRAEPRTAENMLPHDPGPPKVGGEAGPLGYPDFLITTLGDYTAMLREMRDRYPLAYEADQPILTRIPNRWGAREAVVGVWLVEFENEVAFESSETYREFFKHANQMAVLRFREWGDDEAAKGDEEVSGWIGIKTVLTQLEAYEQKYAAYPDFVGIIGRVFFDQLLCDGYRFEAEREEVEDNWDDEDDTEELTPQDLTLDGPKGFFWAETTEPSQ